MRGADLFSGCGGLTFGLMEACRAIGRVFEPVLAWDWDKAAMAVYQANFHPGQVRAEDILALLPGAPGSPASIEESCLIRTMGRLDILVAGPPCQGHSNLNNHTRRNDKRNSLYQRIARFAELFHPTHVLVENVATVVHDQRRAMRTTAAYLEGLGYAVDEKVVDLAALGVPQMRKRHVLVASTVGRPELATMLSRHRVAIPNTVGWAIADLEDEAGDSLFRTPARLSGANIERIRWFSENPEEYNLPNHLRPPCHHGEHSYISMYGRLYWDKPANTLTTGFHSPGQGRYIHPSRERTLTPHEAARLQFFPDFFEFSPADSRKALAHMIGNAVPMKLGYVLGLELLALDSPK